MTDIRLKEIQRDMADILALIMKKKCLSLVTEAGGETEVLFQNINDLLDVSIYLCEKGIIQFLFKTIYLFSVIRLCGSKFNRDTC